ncbi:hypothetical protein HZS61_003275 [Fusarium oxysporum f. sp. conglutinans]|uniref:HTH CENPB-type domain-containing protein n=1 Tax=Fusarium oxysporum f. sp. conglutinans TaxID=100902 RepID=A0A8H6LEY7_FUSOX|nr:hypothetical protein HZS61_003275 [Fusarium oxysporum f. sp. conglutinans]
MPSQANLNAAQAVVLSRARHQKGLSRDASKVSKQPLSLRNAEARHHGSSRATIQRIVKKLEAANSADLNDIAFKTAGRPRILTDEEEEAIVAFVMWMERSGLPACKGEIEEAANTLRLRRNPDAQPVSRMWYRRFRDDHPELDKSILKSLDKSREAWEVAGIDDVKEWFKRLTEVITKLQIGASEIWNADQAGVRVGILRERVECLIVRTKKKSPAQVLSPADRETCTVIGTGNAIGDTIPPWLIFKSFPTLEWAYIDGDPNMRFAQSESAFSNGDITLEWAMEFNRHSWGKSATVQDRQLSFEEYFGCDEHLRKPLEPHISFDVPPKERTPAEKIWRLLIIDGFTGHGAFAFREYCIKFDILVAFLLPHSTHKLQPMDVGVFQWMKNAHQKKLRQALRQGNLSFNRRDFAGAFMKQLKLKQAVDPAYASLLPPEGRFSAASDTARHVGERYHDILSSPTRAGLKHIRNIVNEAMLLEDTIKRYADDRRSRIEKQYNKRKRGKKAKPIGDYIHNVSLQEIRDQQESFIAETRAKEGKSQLRTARSIAIREIERLKSEWRDNKEVIVNGVLKKLQFKKWLQHTGKDKDYLSMDTQRSKMTELLNEKTDGFMIDTQLPQEVRESIRNANFAGKPLNAVDWSALPGSDDSVIFQLTQPLASEESDEEEREEGEEEEEEEILPLIDLSCLNDVEMPSSPPCLPNHESPLSSPLPGLSTPCPFQRHTQLHDSLRDLIREEIIVAESSYRATEDADIL